MAFDWFRRQHNKEETPKAETEQPQQPEPDVPAEAPAAEAPAIAEEYLSFAKAAYQNIQKRQQEAAKAAQTQETTEESVIAEAPAIAPPESVESESPEPTASEPTAEPEPELIELEPSAVEVVAPEEIATPEPIAAVPESVSEAPEEPAIESALEPEQAPELEPTPEPPALLPFWAESEADRLARLEQLRETAIVEPEPEPVAAKDAPPIAVPEFGPDFQLDEGFLWSTEVLAAQGRRAEDISLEEITWLNRLRQGLDKTRRGLINQLRAIVGQGPLNEDAVVEIESALLQADVGVAATDAIIASLQKKLRSETLPPDAAISYLKEILREMLDAPLANSDSPFFFPEKDVLNIWLITGVNGAGKTTTIGKLAHIAQKSGYKCLIAAADTFRAAAVEQVKVWGGRSGVEVIANPGQNTDPAAVVFDAISAAQSRGTELLLVDTAGRLQNKKNLMDELSKVRRIIDKKAEGAIVESLLVLDSTLGQNGLRQAEVFAQAANLSGVVLTKLDGTAKGGIALAVVQQLGLPIRFIGAGEGIEDLRPFSSYEFVEALLNG